LLEATDMAAIMPASLAAHYGRLGVLQVVQIALPLRVPPIHLITRRHRELSPAAAGFVAELHGAQGQGLAHPTGSPGTQ
jgi:DNA-binding transcriptional LysR family regulator